MHIQALIKYTYQNIPLLSKLVFLIQFEVVAAHSGSFRLLPFSIHS